MTNVKKEGVRPPEDDEPRIWALSRRQLLPLSAASAGGALLGAPAVGQDAGAKRLPRKAGAIELTGYPSANPAFLGRYLDDGGLLVWTVRPGGATTAYRLNPAARVVWELANGARSPQAVAKAYAEASRRPAAEASTFLAELVKVAVLTQGGHVVPDGDFPRAEKGVFRPRVSGVRMNRG